MALYYVTTCDNSKASSQSWFVYISSECLGYHSNHADYEMSAGTVIGPDHLSLDCGITELSCLQLFLRRQLHIMLRSRFAQSCRTDS